MSSRFDSMKPCSQLWTGCHVPFPSHQGPPMDWPDQNHDDPKKGWARSTMDGRRERGKGGWMVDGRSGPAPKGRAVAQPLNLRRLPPAARPFDRFSIRP